jgi:hypothetical protein
MLEAAIIALIPFKLLIPDVKLFSPGYNFIMPDIASPQNGIKHFIPTNSSRV